MSTIQIELNIGLRQWASPDGWQRRPQNYIQETDGTATTAWLDQKLWPLMCRHIAECNKEFLDLMISGRLRQLSSAIYLIVASEIGNLRNRKDLRYLVRFSLQTGYRIWDRISNIAGRTISLGLGDQISQAGLCPRQSIRYYSVIVL